MSGFKLLAIRPLEGCDEKYRKNLKEGMLYKFYQDYQFFINDNGNEVELTPINFHKYRNSTISRIEPPKQEVDLYSQGDLKINISAVVGKNGSGKSTLVELLYLVVFITSARSGLLDLNEEQKKTETEIDRITKEITNLEKKTFYKIENDDDKERLMKDSVNIHEYKTNLNQLKNHFKSVKRAIEFANENHVNVEIFYEVNDNSNERIVHRLSSKEKEELKNNGNILTITPNKKNIEDLFYSISLNYSLYGLNSIHIGSWIERLFHKNDGYTTPIVINPMRTLGKIDINRENYLSQSRILANLVDEKFKQKTLAENKKIDVIRFKTPTRKLDTEYKYYFIETTKRFELIQLKKGSFEGIFDNRLSSDILNYFLKSNDLGLLLNGIDPDLIRQYLCQKLFKIARTYPEYRKFLTVINSDRQSISDFEKFVSTLKADKTHKTLKIRQLINTLDFRILFNTGADELKIIYNIDNKDGIKWQNDSLNLKFDEYVKIIQHAFNQALKDFEGNPDDKPSEKPKLIEFIPNSFFEVEVRYKGEDRFESLSSGEQQLVNSINTVVYHLLNIDSISNHYNSINIIFDEIELYFHVDFQRKFVNLLLNSIKKIDLSNIKKINILFSTHSPFILSDIPNQNILLLENGAPCYHETKETFGANMHDLLHDSFFLKEGFMGSFAEKKISRLIDFLQSEREKTKEWDIDKAFDFIQLIGEPYLKQDLFSLYSDKKNLLDEQKLTNSPNLSDEEIDKEIERLTNLKKRRK